MIDRFKPLLVGILVLVTLVSFMTCVRSAQAESDQTSSSITELEAALDHAFIRVLDAEQAGANVTDLLARLNTVGDLLAGAKIAERIGMTTSTADIDSALSTALGVEEAAVNAREKSVNYNENSMLLNIVFSTVGVVVFVLVLFSVWYKLRMKCINRMLEAKPKVKDE